MNSTKYFVFLLLLLLLPSGCKKEKKKENESASSHLANGMLVLNEGLMNMNNSSLSWVDFAAGTVNKEFFLQKTGRLLGDTGNDMKRYGGKIYVVVNVSSTIEVLDVHTGKPVKQVSMLQNGINKQPRYIEFYKDKAFISCFDGYVDVLDTTSLEVVQRIKVGTNPDCIVMSGNKLFVSNSGGLNTPLMDSTVSVIDADAMTELTKVRVGMNPGSIKVLNGKVYVVTRGNYSTVPSRMKRVDIASLQQDQAYPFNASEVINFNNQLLIADYSYVSSEVKIALFNPATNSIENPDYMNLSGVTTFYGMIYRASTNELYVKDAQSYTNSGYIHVYSSGGAYKKKYNVGLNPNSILFYD